MQLKKRLSLGINLNLFVWLAFFFLLAISWKTKVSQDLKKEKMCKSLAKEMLVIYYDDVTPNLTKKTSIGQVVMNDTTNKYLIVKWKESKYLPFCTEQKVDYGKIK